jgi:hypothetical protein
MGGAMASIGLMELIVLFGGSVLVFGPGLLAAVIAWNKGYRPWFWFLAMGPIGLLWILMTPAVAQATTPEERERWETRTDWTGGILTGFTLLPLFALPLLGMLWFTAVSVSVRTAAPMPMPTPPVVTGSVMEESGQSDPTIQVEPDPEKADVKNDDEGRVESK